MATKSSVDYEAIMVRPHLPTVAGNISRYPLVGTDVVFGHNTWGIHVIPELMDVSKFTEALAATLVIYPTFAGRVRKDEESGEWSIELSNAAIPVTVNKRASARIPDDWVVGPFAELLPFVDLFSSFTLVNNDQPLVTIKLSLFPETSTTVIGFVASHHIADAAHEWKFMKTLSEFYQGIPTLNAPAFVIPEPFPTNSSSRTEPKDNEILFFGSYCSEEEIYQQFLQDEAQSSPVAFRISPTQSSKLKAIINSGKREGAEVSRFDALAAYLIHTLNRFISEPITEAHIVWNFRSAVDAVHYGGNAVATVVAKELFQQERPGDIIDIATSIRRSLIRARNPEMLRNALALYQTALVDAANRSQALSIPVGMKKNRATFNSNTAFDWNDIHFGHPGKARFHTGWSGDRFFRFFRSNPHPHVDATTTAAADDDDTVVDKDNNNSSSREGFWDVFFRVESSVASQVSEAIEADMRSLDESGSLSFLL